MSDQNVFQERRDVTGFTGLQFKGVGRIELTQGAHDELLIEAQPEVRERIHTEVRDGVLVIYYESDWKDWTGIRMLGGEKVVFKVVMREVKSLTISGVGNLDSPSIHSDQLTLALSGPGAMTIGELKCSGLNLALSGVGSLDVAGSATQLDVHLSGAGTVKASRLESENAVIKLSGVGTATVWARNTLDVAISGAGVVEYYGSPQITQKNSGLGVLKYLGNR